MLWLGPIWFTLIEFDLSFVSCLGSTLLLKYTCQPNIFNMVIVNIVHMVYMGGEERPEGKNNTSLAAPGALAHRLQRRTACNT